MHGNVVPSERVRVAGKSAGSGSLLDSVLAFPLLEGTPQGWGGVALALALAAKPRWDRREVAARAPTPTPTLRGFARGTDDFALARKLRAVGARSKLLLADEESIVLLLLLLLVVVVLVESESLQSTNLLQAGIDLRLRE